MSKYNNLVLRYISFSRLRFCTKRCFSSSSNKNEFKELNTGIHKALNQHLDSVFSSGNNTKKEDKPPMSFKDLVTSSSIEAVLELFYKYNMDKEFKDPQVNVVVLDLLLKFSRQRPTALNIKMMKTEIFADLIRHLESNIISNCPDRELASITRSVSNLLSVIQRPDYPDNASKQKTKGLLDGFLRCISREVSLRNVDSTVMATIAHSFAKSDTKSKIFSSAMKRKVLMKSDVFSDTDLSTIAWSISRSNDSPEELLSAIESKVLSRICSMSPYSLSNFLWAYTNAKMDASSLMNAVTSELERRVEVENESKHLPNDEKTSDGPAVNDTNQSIFPPSIRFSPRGLMNLLWSYATISPASAHTRQMFFLLQSQVESVVKAFTPHSLASIMWSLGQVGVVYPALLNAVTVIPTAKFNKFTSDNLIAMTTALGQLNLRNTNSLKFIENIMQHLSTVGISSISIASIRDILHTIDTLHVKQHHAFTSEVMKKLPLRSLEESDMSNVCSILSSAAKLNVPRGISQGLFAKVLIFVTSQVGIDSLDITSVGDLLWALSKSNNRGKEVAPFYQLAAVQLVRRRNELRYLSESSLVQIPWSYAVSRYIPSDVFHIAAGELTRQGFDRFNIDQLGILLWSFASSGVYTHVGAFLASIENTISQRDLSKVSAVTSGSILWSLSAMDISSEGVKDISTQLFHNLTAVCKELYPSDHSVASRRGVFLPLQQAQQFLLNHTREGNHVTINGSDISNIIDDDFKEICRSMLQKTQEDIKPPIEVAEIANLLADLGIDFRERVMLKEGYMLDIVLKDKKFISILDYSNFYVGKKPCETLTTATRMKYRHLLNLGWKYTMISTYEWNSFRLNEKAQTRYLEEKLKGFFIGDDSDSIGKNDYINNDYSRN